MAKEFHTIAFDEIIRLSEIVPMTEKLSKEILDLSKHIITEEQYDFAWVMEGVMLQLDEIN